MTDQSSAAPQPGLDASKPKFYQRRWVQLVAVGVVGLALGAGGAAADPTTSDEYQAQASELEDANDALDQANTDVDAANSELEDANDELRTVAGDLPDREDALQEALADLEDSKTELSDAQAALDGRRKRVAEKEKQVNDALGRIEANRITGDGVYEVGRDVKGGTYRTQGGSDCYWAVLGDPNGGDILSNGIPGGPAIVSMSKGQFFETKRCGEWNLQ